MYAYSNEIKTPKKHILLKQPTVQTDPELSIFKRTHRLQLQIYSPHVDVRKRTKKPLPHNQNKQTIILIGHR